MDIRSVLGMYRYVYLDAIGLDSLWAQANERMESQFETTRERGRAGKMSASVGLGRGLGALFGLVDVKGSAEAELSRKSIDQVRSNLAPEQKLRILTESLIEAGPPTFYDTFDSAAAAALGDAVFCLARDVFDAPQFYAGSDGVATANEMGALLFERNRRPEGAFETYRSDDQYYKVEIGKKGAPIVMAASLSKCMSATHGVLGITSHDGVMLRAHQGMDVRLGVFGSLFGIPGAFQIKPYAIWV